MNTSGAKRSEYLVRREAAEVAKAAERSGVPKPADAADGGEAKCSALELLPHCSTFAKRSEALGVCGRSGKARNGAKQGGLIWKPFSQLYEKGTGHSTPVILNGGYLDNLGLILWKLSISNFETQMILFPHSGTIAKIFLHL